MSGCLGDPHPGDLKMDRLEARNRRLESINDMLAGHVATTIETLTRGDELPTIDPNPMQSVIDRLQEVLDAAKREEIV